MNPWITRVDCFSAAGRGIGRLAEAVTAGVPLGRPVPWAQPGLRAPFAALLAERMPVEALLEELVRAVLPAEGGAGLVVATTSGAISGGFEAWHRAGGADGPRVPASGDWPSDRREGEGLWRQDPGRSVAARLGLAPVTTLSVACASGTAAFTVATNWLRDGLCARVVVVGIDVLSLYIHAGFAGLGALSPTTSRPFAADRDGLLIGEGGAAFLLEAPGGPRPPLATVLGLGLSQDAVHLTAPDRTGGGLLRAATMACQDADAVDCVSAHATGTPFNDAMEARALDTLFGRPVPLHAAKPVIGHTLGAAGALEIAALLAYLNGATPPPPRDPGDCPIRIAPCRDPRVGLKLSAAFGGVNAALLLGPDAPSSLRARAVTRTHTGEAAGTSFPLDQLGAPPTLGRADLYVRAGIAALRELPIAEDTALVLSSESNCRLADLRYHRDLVERGPAQVSRVHFTYTIPGSPLAEASILRHARGPVLALCDGPEAGRAEAERLVRWGLAPAAIAVHVEAPGAEARAVAVRYAEAP